MIEKLADAFWTLVELCAVVVIIGAIFLTCVGLGNNAVFH